MVISPVPRFYHKGGPQAELKDEIRVATQSRSLLPEGTSYDTFDGSSDGALSPQIPAHPVVATGWWPVAGFASPDHGSS
jgi:hypothetical protein